VILGVESLFLGWEWGFWGKFAINSKSFEKFAIIRKISEKVLHSACKRLKKLQRLGTSCTRQNFGEW
jgi:hypothetical protein